MIDVRRSLRSSEGLLFRRSNGKSERQFSRGRSLEARQGWRPSRSISRIFDKSYRTAANKCRCLSDAEEGRLGRLVRRSLAPSSMRTSRKGNERARLPGENRCSDIRARAGCGGSATRHTLIHRDLGDGSCCRSVGLNKKRRGDGWPASMTNVAPAGCRVLRQFAVVRQ